MSVVLEPVAIRELLDVDDPADAPLVLSLEQEEAGVRLLEAESVQATDGHITQLVFVAVVSVCVALVSVILSMLLLQNTSVREVTDLFHVMESVSRLFADFTSVAVFGVLRAYTALPSDAFSDHIPIYTLFDAQMQTARNATFDVHTLAFADIAIVEDSLGPELVQLCYDVIGNSSSYFPTLDLAYDMAREGDASGVAQLLESADTGVHGEMFRFLDVFDDVVPALMSHVDGVQSRISDYQDVATVSTVLLMVVLVFAFVTITYRVRRSGDLQAKVHHAMLRCHLADHKAYLEQEEWDCESSSGSTAAPSLSLTSVNASQLRRTRRRLKILLCVFVTLCLANSGVALFAVRQSKRAMQNSQTVQVFVRFGDLSVQLAIGNLLTTLIGLSSAPFPALDWLSDLVATYPVVNGLFRQLSCDPPAMTCDPLTLQVLTPDTSTTQCDITSWSPETMAAGYQAILTSLPMLRMHHILMTGVVGRASKTYPVDHPDVVAVMGSQWSTADGNVTCISCDNGWRLSPDCSRELATALWSGDTDYDGSYVQSLGYEGWTEHGFGVSPYDFANLTTQSVMKMTRRLARTDPTMWESTLALRVSFQHFLDLARAQQLSEIDSVQRWEVASIISSSVLLAMVVTGFALIFNQERYRARTERLVRKEEEWSLDRILQCPGAAQLLLEFTSLSFSQENVMFWLAVHQLKLQRWPFDQVTEVYKKYLVPDSEHEVNLGIELRRNITNFMDALSEQDQEAEPQLDRKQIKLILAAQAEVWRLLFTNAHSSFVQWENFIEYTKRWNAVVQRRAINSKDLS